jgi:glycosyltransferase involved in cell wall biosynthesis
MESTMTVQTPTLCIGILTMNEAHRISKCIQSAQFADQIVVVDSGSTDDTVAIAQSLGAQVHSHADWQGFAEQRNRLLQYCTSDYIFFLDADEEITLPLQQEIETARNSAQEVIWKVLWEQVAYGRSLTHMKSTGGVQRMFKTSHIQGFEGVVHEKAVMSVSGIPIHTFKSPLLHHSRETIYGSLQKLAQYSYLGAAKRAERGKKGGVLRGAASAFANFTQLYIFRRGFLCGPQGFLFCFFIALECFFRYAMLEYDKEKLHKLVKR